MSQIRIDITFKTISKIVFISINLLKNKLESKEEDIFINNMEISFKSIKIPEEKYLKHEMKRFILLIILTFIEIKPKGITILKKLYDRLKQLK